jgi:hypothetical protein
MRRKISAIAGLVIGILVLLSGCMTEQRPENNDTNNDKANTEDSNDENLNDEEPEEPGFIPYNYPPVDLEKVAYILPMGGMSGAHVTPIDHQYYVSYDFNQGDNAVEDITVYSPGDGVVTEIQHMDNAAGDVAMPVDDYRLVIEHSSTISSIYIHIDVVSEKLHAVDPGLGMYASINVEVSAGEILGWYGGSVDYNIVDENVVLGFVNPDSYLHESWKIHCPDPFDYFNESIKNNMVEKCLRTRDPIGGKIAYDIDGCLVGTWFMENTNGYAGLNPSRYWADHLSIVYDSVDPDAIIVSIGTFIDSAKQFAVKGNSPDPANITVANGLVEYELVSFDYYTDGVAWDRYSLEKDLQVMNNDYVQGVLLVQLLEERKLKVEILPGVTGDEVTGFSDAARIYVR